jgi:hypothetical protein
MHSLTQHLRLDRASLLWPHPPYNVSSQKILANCYRVGVHNKLALSSRRCCVKECIPFNGQHRCSGDLCSLVLVMHAIGANTHDSNRQSYWIKRGLDNNYLLNRYFGDPVGLWYCGTGFKPPFRVGRSTA